MAMALAVVVVPPLVGWLALPAGLLARPLLAIAHGVAALPMAQWQTGRPQPWLVALLALALLGWAVPGLGRRRRCQATGLLLAVTAVHLALLGGDRLLVVHEEGGGGRDLLLARHGGRGALIASRGDRVSCAQAGRLAGGLGIRRLDWVLLLDPVAPEEPACWAGRAGRVMAYGEAGPPLATGQRLMSRGLAVQALSMDSHALLLEVGRRRWTLLPDRQALWAWQQRRSPGVERLWLGFVPRPAERRRLIAAGAVQVWLSGPPGDGGLPRGWRTSGSRGWLEDR
jgi:competence protein ComEC